MHEPLSPGLVSLPLPHQYGRGFFLEYPLDARGIFLGDTAPVLVEWLYREHEAWGGRAIIQGIECGCRSAVLVEQVILGGEGR